MRRFNFPSYNLNYHDIAGAHVIYLCLSSFIGKAKVPGLEFSLPRQVKLPFGLKNPAEIMLKFNKVQQNPSGWEPR